MNDFLRHTEIIDWKHPAVLSRAKQLSSGITEVQEIARRCFEWVRDNIQHSGDYRRNPVTCSASEVLVSGTGWCYAKSHLLAGLLRANGIPAGLCYQRLSGERAPYTLHGLNAVELPGFGWYRMDARGNKPGVDAQFRPPTEQLAFEITFPEEKLFPDILPDPLEIVVAALRTYSDWDSVWSNLPDWDLLSLPNQDLTKSPHQSGKIDLILDRLAEYCRHCNRQQVLRIAVDGVDGIGKTTFADKLSTTLTRTDGPVIRASVDDFHNPRAVRYRLGKTSPEGFYLDSYDYPALRRYLLDPLSPGGTGEYCSAVFDDVADSPVPLHMSIAQPGSVLILDGLFLHRPELRSYWDLSIFLDAPFEVTVPRGAARGPGWGSPDPAAPSNRRYVEGQQIYLRENRPQDQANVVIDYSDLTVPLVVAWRLDSK